MLRTRLGDTLGTELAVISAPMGPDLNGPKLVAAISSAGRLGMMQAQLDPPDLLRDALRRVRSLTDKPFGIGFVLHFPCDEGASICLRERVPVLWTFLGRPDPRRRSGSRSWGEDLRASRLCRCGPQSAAGVDAVAAQGIEAGGHVEGEVSTLALVPRAVDAITPVPVIASGSFADGRGLVAALALGAEAAAFGTRFLATHEANVHPLYRDRLLAASEEDTVRTILFGCR